MILRLNVNNNKNLTILRTLYSIGDYCKWEKTGISNNDLERIVPLVKDVIKMFKLPL